MKKPPSEYEEGDTTDHGKKIAHIVAQQENYVIYVGDDGKPGFECKPEFCSAKSRCITKHDEIVWKSFNSLPQKYRDAILTQESYALANAFASSEDSDEHFKTVESLFNAKLREFFCYWYLWGALLAVAIACVLVVISGLYFSFDLSAPIFLVLGGGLMGSLGAFASVLQRLQKLRFNTFHSKSFYFLSGKARGFVGFIFGAGAE